VQISLTVLQPFQIGAGSLLIDMIRLGMGRHIWAVPPENFLPLLNRLFAVYVLYNFGLTLAKTSCLLFYSRIFGPPSNARWFYRALYGTHALNFGVMLGSLLMVGLNSNPRAMLSRNYKLSTNAMWLIGAISSVVIDIILLVLPIPKICKLRIQRSRKFAVLGAFICGYW
jgi:magnesium-transporting ATPase (P-type)